MTGKKYNLKPYLIVLTLVYLLISIFKTEVTYASISNQDPFPKLSPYPDIIPRPVTPEGYCAEKCLFLGYTRCDLITLNDLQGNPQTLNAISAAINQSCSLDQFNRDFIPDIFPGNTTISWCCYGPKRQVTPTPTPEPTPTPVPRNCSTISNGDCAAPNEQFECTDNRFANFTIIKDPIAGGTQFCCCRGTDSFLKCKGPDVLATPQEEITVTCTNDSVCCPGIPFCCRRAEACFSANEGKALGCCGDGAYACSNGGGRCCPDGTTCCANQCCGYGYHCNLNVLPFRCDPDSVLVRKKLLKNKNK